MATPILALTEDVGYAPTSTASALVLIRGIIARFQVAVHAAVAAGASTGELMPVQNEVDNLLATAHDLAEAVTKNTPSGNLSPEQTEANAMAALAHREGASPRVQVDANAKAARVAAAGRPPVVYTPDVRDEAARVAAAAGTFPVGPDGFRADGVRTDGPRTAGFRTDGLPVSDEARFAQEDASHRSGPTVVGNRPLTVAEQAQADADALVARRLAGGNPPKV